MLNPVKLPQSLPNGIYINPQNNAPVSKETALNIFKHEKQKRYNDINTHEKKHKAAGGDQAGSIVINTDSNGIATDGHVSIEMPDKVNKANPKETLRMAQIAYNSATAPDDMSPQDRAVASKAQSVMSQANTALNEQSFSKGSKLNLLG